MRVTNSMHLRRSLPLTVAPVNCTETLKVASPTPPAKVHARNRTVWIPPGEWTDGFGGKTVTGPQTLNLTNVSMETMPLYHRRGGLVVTALPARNAATVNFSTLVLQCWPHSARYIKESQATQKQTQAGTQKERDAQTDMETSVLSTSRVFHDTGEKEGTWSHVLSMTQRWLEPSTSGAACSGGGDVRRVTVHIGSPAWCSFPAPWILPTTLVCHAFTSGSPTRCSFPEGCLQLHRAIGIHDVFATLKAHLFSS
jgi:hypothetical protein